MTRPLALVAATLAALIAALPAAAAPGLRFNWDRCFADGRVANKAFACDTNAGSDVIVCSFEPPVEMLDAVGMEMVFHLKSSSGSLPAWWQFANGACRTSAFSYDVSHAFAGGCEYPYSANAGGGVVVSSADFLGPGSQRLLAVTAVPSSETIPVSPGYEYFAIALVVRHIRTVGTGACGGCTTPMCFGFGSLRLVNNAGTQNLDLVAGGPNLGGSDEAVTWQGAYVRDYSVFSPFSNTFASMTCDPDASTGVRSRTWSAVKALYR